MAMNDLIQRYGEGVRGFFGLLTEPDSTPGTALGGTIISAMSLGGFAMTGADTPPDVYLRSGPEAASEGSILTLCGAYVDLMAEFGHTAKVQCREHVVVHARWAWALGEPNVEDSQYHFFNLYYWVECPFLGELHPASLVEKPLFWDMTAVLDENEYECYHLPGAATPHFYRSRPDRPYPFTRNRDHARRGPGIFTRAYRDNCAVQ
ncbi:hypothetical protein ACFQ78_19725 [Streptomyces sp. NPDC056519]|uniref:hypothetical protein n=1 Tax=Streptomyces sp. NPDC056519 TaxID=3345849 RepID=UPI0036A3CA58